MFVRATETGRWRFRTAGNSRPPMNRFDAIAGRISHEPHSFILCRWGRITGSVDLVHRHLYGRKELT